MKKRLARYILGTGVCLMLAGCGAQASAAESTQAVETVAETQESEAQESGKKERRGGKDQEKSERRQDGQMAKVVSVGEDELTVLLAEQPERKEKPENEESTEKPEAKGERPEKSEAKGERPQKSGNGKPGGGRGEQHSMEMTYSEESTVLTLTEETVIRKGMGQEKETVTLSDLEADSIIRLVLDGTTVVSIDVMESK